MKRYSTIMSVLLTLSLPVAGISAEKAGMPAGHAMTGGATAADGAAQNPSGKVIETMEGGGYSYANLEKDGKKTWVAFPSTATRVGEMLSFSGCMPMPGFQSKALNRQFESILFCGAPEGKANQPAPKATPTPAQKSPGSSGAAAATQKIKVGKASGANAYTVAEIFAKSGKLNGKQVVVKGQVVKVSSGIMSRNWIHLQDGSGSEQKKTHDLVITSDQLPKTGEVVTLSGKLAKDKDFGGGYKYSAIIENGKLKK